MPLFFESCFRTHYTPEGNFVNARITVTTTTGKTQLTSVDGRPVENTLEHHMEAVYRYMKKKGAKEVEKYHIHIGKLKDDFYFIVDDWTRD